MLPTVALCSSHATHAAADDSAPPAIGPKFIYNSGKVVQTNGATSVEDRNLVSFVLGEMCDTFQTTLVSGPGGRDAIASKPLDPLIEVHFQFELARVIRNTGEIE